MSHAIYKKKQHKMNSVKKTIIYDRVCIMCSSIIAFLMEKDPKDQFEYQGSAQDYIEYIKDQKHYIRSRAVLEILKDLGYPWKLLYIFMIVPPFIRDFIYNAVARNRNKFF